MDVDLGVTPLTNALPINRLGLSEGAGTEIRAAWVRFPVLSVEASPQGYERLGRSLYRYTGIGTGFTARVEVDGHGFPVTYEGLWRRA